MKQFSECKKHFTGSKVLTWKRNRNCIKLKTWSKKRSTIIFKAILFIIENIQIQYKMFYWHNSHNKTNINWQNRLIFQHRIFLGCNSKTIFPNVFLKLHLKQLFQYSFKMFGSGKIIWLFSKSNYFIYVARKLFILKFIHFISISCFTSKHVNIYQSINVVQSVLWIIHPKYLIYV